MKQIVQSLRSGEIRTFDLPRPALSPGRLQVRTQASLISAGTERMLLEFGRADWINKARQQPDKVKQTLEKVRNDGLVSTLEAVRSKLDQPLSLGYCNVGEVIGIGRGVEGFRLGDRVVSNGPHAEIVSVPANLCVRVPDAVPSEQAPFAVVAAIGLQGVRLIAPTLGECVVVTGLGLIGLLSVQLLRAHGCRVLGIDTNPARLALAREFGADTVDLSRGEDPLEAAKAFSRGRGVDAVLLAASTRSNEPLQQAARMSRKRGRIVLVGVTGLEISRADFYEKELSFQVSCSYGPGRYDPAYEEQGHDYPYAYVRWTEQRNFEAVLDLMERGDLRIEPLISHRFPLERAQEAYTPLVEGQPATATVGLPKSASSRPGRALAWVGAGNYAGRMLLPAFKGSGLKLRTLVGRGGVGAAFYAQRFGFEKLTSDEETLWRDPEVDTLVIATRHDSHARWVLQALGQGKHVFVEKPLCLSLDELEAIEAAHAQRPELKLMVGFNRRFAPHVPKMRELLSSVDAPKAFVMTVNAGFVPRQHWSQDPLVGGGRLVGEACHFIDLLRHLAGAEVLEQDVMALGPSASLEAAAENASIQLRFADGSIGTIHYLANGHRRFPKERLEVFCAGRILQLDNFRVLRGYGWPNFKSLSLWKQDKGQRACVQAFADSLRGGDTPIPAREIFEVSRLSILADQAARA